MPEKNLSDINLDEKIKEAKEEIAKEEGKNLESSTDQEK